MKWVAVVALLAVAACEPAPDVDWFWTDDPVMVEEMGKRGFTYDPSSDMMLMNDTPVFQFDRRTCFRGCYFDRTVFLGPTGTGLESKVIVAFLQAKEEAVVARDERFLKSIGVTSNE